jgi:phosphonopyruvate decarboxylase
MIAADDFIMPAKAQGFDFYTGVPCSFLTALINRVISDRSLDYIGAASEGEAVAIAAGAWLGGRSTVVMCQNSGLGNAVNPLTSLNHPFRIPTLLIATWRGQPGFGDAPQHELMGQITAALLDTIKVPHRPFPADLDEVGPALDEAQAVMAETDLPFAFIMEKGAVRESGLEERAVPPKSEGRSETLTENGERPTRAATLERFLAAVPDEAAVIATTGKCGRELFTLADRPQHFYQVGSMGCASGMALGVALNVRRPVVVLDGDGSALMQMGTLATIGAHRPANLVHVLLDNGVHDSTGGQATVSSTVDFSRVALACGYSRAMCCDSLDGFERALRRTLGAEGPGLVHMRILPGSMSGLGRPTVPPPEMARRFKAFLASSEAGG